MRGVRNIYYNRLNKKASHGDRFFVFPISKKGQFFILSAVIIASIIVGLATTKNYVSTGDAPKKFYYYSQQLEDETGAVVDYALYNSEDSTNLNEFLQYSIDRTLESDSNMEIFACYSALDSTKLICQNNGTRPISVLVPGSDAVTLYGSRSPEVVNFVCESFDFITGECVGQPITLDSFIISNKDFIYVTPQGSQTYSVSIKSSSVQRNQFYLLLKMNTSSGDYVADSTGTKESNS